MNQFFKNKIASNLLSLSSAEIAKRLLGFLSLAYLGRVLDPGGFGVIGFAAAVVSYFALFIDFGFNTLGMREIAKDRTVLPNYVNHILSLRLLLALVLLVLLIFYLIISELESVTKSVILVTGISLFANAINLSWVFQAVEKMQHIAVRQILVGVLSLSGIVIFVKTGSDVLIAASILTISALIGNVWYIPIYKKLFAKIKLQFTLKFWNELIKASLPLAFSALMINIYYNLDMVMLGYMKTEKEVGIYNAAYKIFSLGLIPIHLVFSSYFPALSRIGLNNTEEFRSTIKNYGKLIVGAGIIAGLFILLMPERIIHFIFGENYLDASVPLSILAINAMIIGVNSFLGNPLVAWGKIKSYSIAVTFGAISNIILNFILIPVYSYNGAAVATLLSEITVLIGLLYLFNKFTSNLTTKSL